MNYWEATVKYLAQDENGNLKKMSSLYLVEAYNHTDVEATLTEKASQFVTGEFDIKPIRMIELSDVIDGRDKDTYYKLKFEYEFDKKYTELSLVSANSITDAVETLRESLSNNPGVANGFEIVSAQKTKIIDVFFKDNLLDMDLSFDTYSVSNPDADEAP
jgi:hypothetical protein